MSHSNHGKLIKSGYTPLKFQLWINSNMIIKVKFEYSCDIDTNIYSNVYLLDETGDFPHVNIKLKKTKDTEYKSIDISIKSLSMIGKKFGHVRIWSEDDIPVRIRNVEISVVDAGKLTMDTKIHYKKPDGAKTLILILDKERKRSPLLTDFYRELCKNDKYEFIMNDEVDKDIHYIVNKLGGRKPDLIYAGFDTGRFFFNSKNYITKYNIPVISETGDNDLFGKQRICVKRLKDIPMKMLITHSLYKIDKLEETKKTFWYTKNSELIFVPWCINPLKYYRKLKRDIDVACISTTSGGFKYHGNKLKVKSIVKKIKSINGKPTKKFTNNVYGKDYIKILNKTKIFVVAGRARLTLPQKYLEGAACGCMLIGEISPEIDDILIDGESIVAVKMGDYSDLSRKIRYYLKHPDERKRIARNGKKAILKHFSVKNVSKTFIKELENLGVL